MWRRSIHLLVALSLTLGLAAIQPPAAVRAELDLWTGSYHDPNSCGGTGDMAANSQSGWPNVAEGTNISAWGDVGSNGGCRSENFGSSGSLPDDSATWWRHDFVEGESYVFRVDWRTDANVRCLDIEWGVASSAPVGGGARNNMGGTLLGSAIGDNQCKASTTYGVSEWVGVAPAGVTAVRYAMASYLYTRERSIEAIGVAEGPDPPDEPPFAFENCVAPDPEGIDLDFFGWMGCMLLEGLAGIIDVIRVTVITFVAMLQWIGGLIGDVATAVLQTGEDIVGSIVEWVGGIPTLIGELLEFLFIPSTIGDQWATFIGNADGKVPIGWLSEAVDVILGFADPAIAGSDLPLTLTIMGAPVEVDTSVTGPVEQFRPALVAVVYVSIAWAIIRLVRSTVGGEG
jgi:hypothetical protein